MPSEIDELLRLLQLASPALPVGAYSYAEGLEFLAETGRLRNRADLRDWIGDALDFGAIRVEGAVLLRAHDAWTRGDGDALQAWDAWLSATRESEELRRQSADMGRALLRLLRDLHPAAEPLREVAGRLCNFAVAFALAAAHWGISREDALPAYLHAWAANLVGAGVKLIPLGQTEGQRLLWELQTAVASAAGRIRYLDDDELDSFGWGLALASMGHETQYSRLFRS